MGEHGIGDAGQLVLACLFLSVWVADTFFVRATTFLNAIVPPALRIPAGVIVFIFGAVLAKLGLSIVFGEERERPVLIREGAFGLVRHPVYLGEILFYLALLMFSLSLASAAIWFLGIIFMHYISRYEERLLIDYFGEEYRAYMNKVPMWIPKIRLKKQAVTDTTK